MDSLVFDKGLKTERRLPVGNIFMRPFSNSLNANANFTNESYPDIEKFVNGGKEFSKFCVENENGVERPIYGNYTTVLDFTVSYHDATTGSYDINIGSSEF